MRSAESTPLAYTSPFSFHLPKMRLQAASASLSASSGVALPAAAFANITVRTQVFQIGNSLRKAGEVVELAGQEPLPEVADVVDEELLGPLDVLRELPDDV